LADRLGLKLLDLVTFPDEDDRQRLVDRMRKVARGPIRKILNDLGDHGSKRRKGGAKGAAAAASTGGSARRGAKARQTAAASPSEGASPGAAGKRARKAKPAR
jgi:hypothetical protein